MQAPIFYESPRPRPSQAPALTQTARPRPSRAPTPLRERDLGPFGAVRSPYIDAASDPRTSWSESTEEPILDTSSPHHEGARGRDGGHHRRESRGVRRVRLSNVKDLLFSQGSIAPDFSDGTSTRSLLKRFLSGAQKPDDLPPLSYIVRHQDNDPGQPLESVSCDNRRLCVLKAFAALKPSLGHELGFHVQKVSACPRQRGEKPKDRSETTKLRGPETSAICPGDLVAASRHRLEKGRPHSPSRTPSVARNRRKRQ